MDSAAGSKDPTPKRDVNGWLEQHDRAVRVGHAEHQHLRADRTDLSWWKVEDGDAQLAAQLFRPVMHRQLCAGAAAADWPKSRGELRARRQPFGEGPPGGDPR